MDSVARANHIILTVRSSVSVGFVHQGPGPVSANAVHRSWHAG